MKYFGIVLGILIIFFSAYASAQFLTGAIGSGKTVIPATNFILVDTGVKLLANTGVALKTQ